MTGSKDGSKRIAEKYENKYPNKITYLEKQNGGLSDARNYGMSYARGEYIAFLDSDDYVELNMYKEMYELAKKENSDLVQCSFYWKYPNKQKLAKVETYENKKEMLIKTRVEAWNKLIKREVLEKANIEFPKGYRYEDVEFTYKLVPYIEKVSFLIKPYIHYVQRENSISNSQNERTKEIFDILEHVLNYYREKKLYDEFEQELEYIYARYLLCSSLLRMTKIQNKTIREELLQQTWENLNSKFPNWKKNKILKNDNSIHGIYMKTMNKVTFKIYTKILGVV